MHKVLLRSLAAAVMVGGLTVAGVGAQAAQTTLPASEKPLPNTARVIGGYVYGIDSNGTTTVVVGDFTTVRDYAAGSPEQTRNYVFAYDNATGRVSQTFVPVVNGVGHAVQFTADGTQVLLGGAFNTVNGTARRGIVRLNVSDGSIDQTFKGQTSGAVLDLEMSRDEIVVGGYFDNAGGLKRPRLAALDPGTGLAIPSFNLALSGILHPLHPEHKLRVEELDVSDDGRWLVVLGNQTAINGVSREQVALVDLDTYSLADWSAPALGGWPCSTKTTAGTWVKDVAFAPDSRYLVTGAFGAFHADTLCDTVARFELPPVSTGAVTPTWVDYTGGDSIFKVAVTDAAVYAGGHQRWFNNHRPSTAGGALAGDEDGPGSVQRYGIGALDPTSGVPLSWFPNRDGSRPTRGFEAIVPFRDLLLLGSDSNLVGGLVRQRVAAFATAGGRSNPAPEKVTAPAHLYALGADGVVRRASFTGTPSAATPVSGTGLDGVDWSTTRDGFLQYGNLTAFADDGAYYRRTFRGTVGAPVNLSTSVGYVDNGAQTLFDQPYGVQTTRAAAFTGGRIVYTRSDSTNLFWRWYSNESGIIGSQEFVLDSSRNWRDQTASMEVIGTKLYVAETGRVPTLVSHDLVVKPASIAVTPGTRTVVDQGASGVDWSTTRGLFAAPASTTPVG